MLTVADTADRDVALAAAEQYRALRAGGITTRSSIEVHCVDKGHLLLHRDRGFDAFEAYRGLRVWHHCPATRT